MTRSTHTLPAGAGFWVVAIVFFLAMSYSTVPTPLYPIYEQADGYPVWMITVIFAAYAVGVVGGLLLLGPVSDWAGRRRMSLIALALVAVAALLFIVWTEVPALLVARVVNGVGIGILSANATAHLGELRARTRPKESPVIAATVAGVATIGGLALGPIVGGLFAEFVDDPLFLPNVIYLVVILVCAVAMAFVPETVNAVAGRGRYRPQRLVVPPSSRSAFGVAGLGAFSAFALLGTFTTLTPVFLVDTFGDRDHLLAGLTAASVFASAAIAQAALMRVALRRQLTTAIVCCTLGLVAVAIGSFLPSLVLFVLGGIISGVGVGILFRSAIATAGALTDPARRGETLALLFLIAYLGLIVPVVSVGLAAEFVNEQAVMVVFAVLVLAATVSAGVAMRRRASA
ncbi:MFS transporter [Microbacterium awajiense]|uniref:MFS transporter n=1 Tax=Microbacterium awajiense TaxID=415214 RepID=A0ABP7AP53_9MICO